jgi:mannose-6-phosphate isomerase-like protein (cupin superfamily)
MSAKGLGGDPPCWAHLFDDEATATGSTKECGLLVADLGPAQFGSGGAIWSLPHGGDLDANLVRLDPGADIGSHVNDEVDVLLFVQSGTGVLTVNENTRLLGADHLALISKGSRRSIVAGDLGITYLSVHRRRGPLEINRRDEDRRLGPLKPLKESGG